VKLKYFFILFLSFFINDVFAKRVALVIGNDGYQYVSKLQKAKNDADAMAKELREAGFTVSIGKDVNYRAMVRLIEVFLNGVNGGDDVVIFYAGHGIQLKNGSYLLPIDIEAETEGQIEKTSYGLNDLAEKLSETKANFSLIIVDACRDNPIKSKGRSVGNSKGLNAIEPAKGQMIVYSASRGQTALDRLSENDPNPNGLFTREFISRMRKDSVKVEDIVREVQDAVETLAKTVGHEQRPALYNESRGAFYFANSSVGTNSSTLVKPIQSQISSASSHKALIDKSDNTQELIGLYRGSIDESDRLNASNKIIELNKSSYRAPFYFDQTVQTQENYFVIPTSYKKIPNDRVLLTFFTRKIQNFLIFKTKNELVSHGVFDCKNKQAGVHLLSKVVDDKQLPPEIFGNPELMRLLNAPAGSIFDHLIQFACNPYGLQPIVPSDKFESSDWVFAFNTNESDQVFFNKALVRKYGSYSDVALKTVFKTHKRVDYSEKPTAYLLQRFRLDCPKKLVSIDSESLSSELILTGKSVAYGSGEFQQIKEGTTGDLAYDLGCKR